MTSGLSRRAVFGAAAAPLMCMPLMGAPAERFSGAISVRDFGAVGDGRSDDTAPLARAHASNRPVYYPRTAAFYRISHVIQLTGSASSDGAEVRIEGNGDSSRSIFLVSQNTNPITIEGLILNGSYKGGEKGEWSHCIDLRGATGVTIKDNTLREPYGDCIYIGSYKGGVPSRQIAVEGNRLLNPRRCNVAVVCGDKIAITNNWVKKPIRYVASIDLEPDRNASDYVRDVLIDNNTFDTTGPFITAGVNNGIENTGLRITRNRGRAFQLVKIYDNAKIRGAVISDNRFKATSADGNMLWLSKANEVSASNNVDSTRCADAYKSIQLYESTVSLKNNQSCP